MSYAYDGSAVRVLEEDTLTQPRPLERPRHQTVARPKASVREAGAVAPFAVAGFAAVAVLAVLILMSFVQLNTLSREMVTLDNQMTELKSQEAVLTARYELAYDLSAIEAAVTADGSMGRPQAGQMVYVDLTEPDSVVVYDRSQTQGSFLDAARQLVERVLSYF